MSPPFSFLVALRRRRIGVGLIGVVEQQAVVDGVEHIVAIGIGVAGVAAAITVHVGLIDLVEAGRPSGRPAFGIPGSGSTLR